jgi:hypothetical protein
MGRLALSLTIAAVMLDPEDTGSAMPAAVQLTAREVNRRAGATRGSFGLPGSAP